MRVMGFISVAPALAVMVATSVTAQDGPGFYVSTSLGSVELKDKGEAIRNTVVLVRPGYSFGQILDVEGEFAFTVDGDNINPGGPAVEVSSRTFGHYAKGNLPISERFSTFGRVGWINTDLTVESGGRSASEDDDAFAFGFGFEYGIFANADIRFDATWAVFDDAGSTTESRTLGLGLTWKF